MAKNEELPPEFIVGDVHTALKSYITPNHELVRDLGDLTVKQFGHLQNLPGILDGCFGWLQEPYEEEVMASMKELRAKHQALVRRSRLVLINTKELTRGKRAGECLSDGEWDVEDVEELIR